MPIRDTTSITATTARAASMTKRTGNSIFLPVALPPAFAVRCGRIAAKVWPPHARTLLTMLPGSKPVVLFFGMGRARGEDALALAVAYAGEGSRAFAPSKP